MTSAGLPLLAANNARLAPNLALVSGPHSGAATTPVAPGDELTSSLGRQARQGRALTCVRPRGCVPITAVRGALPEMMMLGGQGPLRTLFPSWDVVAHQAFTKTPTTLLRENSPSIGQHPTLPALGIPYFQCTMVATADKILFCVVG